MPGHVHGILCINCKQPLGHGFWHLRCECFLLLLIPLGEVIDVALLVEKPVWTIHEVMCSAIVACAVGRTQRDPVLFCKDEAVLLSLNTTGMNIWR